MEALRSSKCANGDSTSGGGRSFGRTPRMNAITAIATTHVIAMITNSPRYSNDGSGRNPGPLLHVGQILVDLVLVLREFRVVQLHGSDFGQGFGFPVLLYEHPDDHQPQSDRS